jgi:hypothetical protein
MVEVSTTSILNRKSENIGFSFVKLVKWLWSLTFSEWSKSYINLNIVTRSYSLLPGTWWA